MPTFLPFLRAVKAPSTSRVVCALFIGSAVNCGPANTPHASVGPPTGPLPTASYTGTSTASASAEPSATDAGSALAAADSTAPPSPSPSPQVSVDLPYPVDARPRAPDPTQAAAEDEELARWNVGGSSDPNSISSQASYHPGTRVVVDTRPAKRRAGAPPLPAPRGLSYQRVQAQARSRGYWPFRVCFERGQRDKKGPGGETRVAFSIGTRGKVTAARLLDSKLENAASAACMVRELQKLEFSPAPASKMRLVASIQVYPGDADLPVVPDPAVIASLPRGEFDPESMRARVTAKQAELDACFSEGRRTDPALWGRLALSVILELDGTVHRVSEVESHFPSATATRCAQIVLSSVVFPSVNGKPFSFVVPLRLPRDPTLEARGDEQTETKKKGPDENPSPSPISDDPQGD
jgi:hypothetical protein